MKAADPQPSLMDDRALVGTVLAFRDFRAPQGVSFSVEIVPDTGGCRVWVRLAVKAGGLRIGIEAVPDDTYLRNLLRAAESMLQRWPVPRSGGFPLDLSTMGRDQ